MTRARRMFAQAGRLVAVGTIGAAAIGCDTLSMPWTRKAPTTEVATGDSAVIRSGVLEPGSFGYDEKYAGDMAKAHDLFRQEKYEKAVSIFHRVADKSKNVQTAEEARFYQAECYRLSGRYPKAIDAYHRMLMDFASGVHRQEAAHHMYEIANYWLDDTRAEIQRAAAKKTDKSWSMPVIPAVFHFDKSKPLLDEEGRALQALEYVHLADIRGPLGEKSLFLAGKVKLFREDYRAADDYFSQLIQQYPNGELTAEAIECAIFAKHMSTGGPNYDDRKSAEAFGLIQMAHNAYPELVAEKGQMLDRQMVGIRLQQAEKDFRTAEFYRRTGHYGSAYFYYELVRRRYPGTPQAETSTQRMLELRHAWENPPNYEGFTGMMRKGWNQFLGRPEVRPQNLAANPTGEGQPTKPDNPDGQLAPPPRKQPTAPEDGAQMAPAPRKLPDSLPQGVDVPR